jgi:hypothetical protein
VPETDEDDTGEEVLTGGQLTTDDWLARGRIEKRRRWSHTAQQHSAVGEKRVVVGGGPTLHPHGGGERGFGRRALRQGGGGDVRRRQGHWHGGRSAHVAQSREKQRVRSHGMAVRAGPNE